MKINRILLNSLPLLLLGGAMVYAAAPNGGYIPGATTDPDCVPGETDCFVQVFSDTDDQTLSLSGNTLAISEGNNVLLDNISTLWGNITGIPADISDGDDDNQTLALSGADLSIEDGNMVDLSTIPGVGGDNLGNHTATQNLDLTTFQLVGNSGTSGISVANNGSVGIGTTSPARTLHVNGITAGLTYRSLRTDDTAVRQHVEFARLGESTDFASSDKRFAIRSKGDGSGDTTDLRISYFDGTSNLDTITILNSGNVGIGTVSPSEALQVDGGGRFQGTSNNNEINGVHIDWVGAENLGRVSAGNAAGSSLAFYTNNSGNSFERMRIDNNGNVGIGTTTPTEELEVYDGSVKADGFRGKRYAYTTVGHAHGIYSAFSPTDNRLGSLGFVNTINDPDNPGGRFFISIDTNNDEVNQTTEQYFTIIENGNVGIGTTSPDSKLSVVGLPSGTTDSVTPGNLAGAVCITDAGNMYIDTDGTCANPVEPINPPLGYNR